MTNKTYWCRHIVSWHKRLTGAIILCHDKQDLLCHHIVSWQIRLTSAVILYHDKQDLLVPSYCVMTNKTYWCHHIVSWHKGLTGAIILCHDKQDLLVPSECSMVKKDLPMRSESIMVKGTHCVIRLVMVKGTYWCHYIMSWQTNLTGVILCHGIQDLLVPSYCAMANKTYWCHMHHIVS